MDYDPCTGQNGSNQPAKLRNQNQGRIEKGYKIIKMNMVPDYQDFFMVKNGFVITGNRLDFQNSSHDDINLRVSGLSGERFRQAIKNQKIIK